MYFMHKKHIAEITKYLSLKAWNLYAITADNTKEDTPEWGRHALF